MLDTTLTNGLTISHPDDVKATAGAVRRTRSRAAVATGAPAPSLDLEPLVRALAQQGLTLAGRFSLEPQPQKRRRAAAGEGGPSTVGVDLGANEDAVVLTVDANDDVDWVLPSGESIARRRSAARGGARRVTFTIAARTAPARGRKRGLAEKVAAGVLGFVFKFVRGRVTKRLIDHLERSVTPGLVQVNGTLSAQWPRLGTKGKLPKAAPKSGAIPRVLLLIHGTFSSTVGSYGGLSFSDQGVALLTACLGEYDHVIGWDHRTLSEEPRPNAEQILEGLDRLFGPGGASIDAVGYSRGGLVLRSLLEQVMPGTPWDGRVRRAVFVGCTLNGTRLAQEKQWKNFVDIYTNITIAACRGVSAAVPPAAVTAVWVETISRGLSVLVRFLASALLDKGGVPGLTAMDPDKSVVQQFNARAVAGSASYRALTNDYEPGIAAPDGVVLPAPFKLRAANAIMDAQMKGANDLVVNTSSMNYVGLGALPAAQVRALPPNGRTIHTTYFRDPDVIAQLSEWLLGRPLVVGGPRSRTRSRGAAAGASGRHKPGGGARKRPARSSTKRPSRKRPSAKRPTKKR
ncbi:MAG: hypothetical protein IT361_07495 [Gemmatimonadaceae bacterium]|nr:hypothetical protein [Gemmatimonadaceae bacterium]